MPKLHSQSKYQQSVHHLPATESVINKPRLSIVQFPTYRPRKPFTEATLLPKIRLGHAESSLVEHPIGPRCTPKKIMRKANVSFITPQNVHFQGHDQYHKYFNHKFGNSSEDDVGLTSETGRRPSQVGTKTSNADVGIRQFAMASSRMEMPNNHSLDFHGKVDMEVEGIVKKTTNTKVIIKDRRVALDSKRLM